MKKYSCDYKRVITLEVAETEFWDAQTQGIEDFCNGLRDHTVFYAEGYEKALFIIIHGDENGNVGLKGVTLTPIQLLQLYLPKMKAKGLSDLITISCFGGLQQPAELDGCKVYSLHHEVTEIFCSPLFGGLDIHPAIEEGEKL